MTNEEIALRLVELTLEQNTSNQKLPIELFKEILVEVSKAYRSTLGPK